ncbi:hypothetical protein O0I10_006700 [Lichtheimia ornata]|uniref:Uncharacterized protein n=1 Tax=Lichtheimia ornata TaxID=688661 RepID=A0AAD7XUM4_9FUNG|nr:uncharacterized protein O0I10_006700 [Lichtheimia ornata]KAJ8657634.1 hypothetical protein O0I10_006700 [Lichtheimia ornata]
MKDSAASPDLLQDPKTIRLHECKNSKQIEAATDIIQQSASRLYSALHDRAKLLANSAQFEAALRDAAAMQTIRPTSALGYLCEGDVLCQQGRSEAAVAIYDKGLEVSSSSSDPHYHDLQQQRIAAKTMSNKRIDFISQLPMDVVSTYIVPRFMPTVLSSTGYCPYLHVSDTWQQRILEHGLSIEVDYELRTFREGHEQLVQFAPYVTSLDLIVRMNKHLVHLFSRAKFSSLKKLKLGSETNESQLRGLAMVADTLTHLDIGYNSSLRLCDIMRTCPNLTFLKFQDVNAFMPPPPSSSKYPRLTHLRLHSWSSESIEKNNIARILSLFPNLVSFEIWPMPEDSSILPLLSQQCPHLRTISYGREMETGFDIPRVDVKEKGITFAGMGEGETLDQDELIKFLFQHHKSLKVLDMSLDIAAYGHSAWDFMDGKLVAVKHDNLVVPLSLPNLHTVRVAVEEYSAVPCLQWVLENAPLLETVSVPESILIRDTVRGLKQLKHLTTLDIIEASGLVDDGVIGPLLQHHAALGDKSMLKHIEIDFVTAQISNIAWLPLVCDLKYLKKLDLSANYFTADWRPFLSNLGKGCPALEELTLGHSITNFHEGLIAALDTHPNLKTLYIGASRLSEHELRHLGNFPRLQRVYLCFPVPDSIANYLRQHMEVIY